MNKATKKKMYRRAKELLETVGWVQGTEVRIRYEDDPETEDHEVRSVFGLGLDEVVGFCAIGACKWAWREVNEGVMIESEDMFELAKCFEPELNDDIAGMSYEVVTRENDRGSRTKNEVLSAFDCAIRLCEEDGATAPAPVC